MQNIGVNSHMKQNASGFHAPGALLYHSFAQSCFLLLPLEHGASVKRSVSLLYPKPYRQSVELLERGDEPCHKAATYTEYKHRKNADRHPCLQWGLKP